MTGGWGEALRLSIGHPLGRRRRTGTGDGGRMQSIRASSRGETLDDLQTGRFQGGTLDRLQAGSSEGGTGADLATPPDAGKCSKGQAPTPESAARGPRKEKAATAASASDSLKGETPAKFQIRFFATVHEDWKRQLLQHQRRTLGKGGNARKIRNRVWCDSPRRLEEAEFSKPGRGQSSNKIQSGKAEDGGFEAARKKSFGEGSRKKCSPHRRRQP